MAKLIRFPSGLAVCYERKKSALSCAFGIYVGAGSRDEKKDENGQYTYHTIKPRETLYSVSVRYQIPATRIIEANPGLSTKTFLIGKTIRIPSLTEEKVEKIPEKKVKTVKKGKEKAGLILSPRAAIL